MNILITGTSRGIGNELVKYFSTLDGVNIFAISRNIKPLHDFTNQRFIGKNTSIKPILYDIANIGSDAASLLSQLPANMHMDILINNAGYLVSESFEKLSMPDIDAMFNINCIAPVLLIKALLPHMGKTSHTHVVNISSMGGFQGSVKFAGLSWYSASKAALACMTECLQTENKDQHIAFNCLALGAVQTEMLGEAFPGYKAPLSAVEMAEFIGQFALKAGLVMRGKIIPVSLSTP